MEVRAAGTSALELELGLTSQAQLKLPDAAQRTRSLAETEGMLDAIRARVPITRVGEITALDTLGHPVFVAVTPLAKDLTTHAGKGSTAQAARVSAMMEAVERVSAESLPPERIERGTVATLRERFRARVFQPDALDLPDDTRYSPLSSFAYTWAYDLMQRERVLMPADLVISPGTEGVLHAADTNGLAAGNTRLEAVVHGICEVIERDALSLAELATLYGDAGRGPVARAIHAASMPEWAVASVKQVADLGMELRVFALETDLGVSVLQATLYDPDFPARSGSTLASFPGFGAHPDPEVALRRCLNEAFQSRVAYIQGARDAFNNLQTSLRGPSVLARMRRLTTRATLAFQELPCLRTADLRHELQWLLQRLEKAGVTEVLVADLTRDHLGIPVVRVRIPALACYVVDRRRIAWRGWRVLVA